MLAVVEEVEQPLVVRVDKVLLVQVVVRDLAELAELAELEEKAVVQ